MFRNLLIKLYKMKTNFILIVSILLFTQAFAQVTTNNNQIWFAKEFSKDEALFDSKNFLFKDVLGTSSDVVQFDIIPLAAASSGELTTLLYKCDSKQKEGLILGFYGNYWNPAGVVYQGYAFKNLQKEKAIEFLSKIQNAIDDNSKYLKRDNDNNNIYFSYDDIDVLIWTTSGGGYMIRLFWDGFDSSWEATAFERSKERFEKKNKITLAAAMSMSSAVVVVLIHQGYRSIRFCDHVL